MNPSENQTRPAVEDGHHPDPWLDWLLSLPALWVGTVLAFLSVADGIRNSVLHSLDFQWSPARLLAHHVDPWATYLAGDPGHRILLNQVPNDLHELYVAMLPFGYLPLMPAKIIWALHQCGAGVIELLARRTNVRTEWSENLVVYAAGADQHLRTSHYRERPDHSPGACIAGTVGDRTKFPITWTVSWNCLGQVQRAARAGRVSTVATPLAIFALFAFAARCRVPVLLCMAATRPSGRCCGEPFRTSTNNVSPGLANIMAVSEIALRHPPLFRPVPDAFYLSPVAGWVAALPTSAGSLWLSELRCTVSCAANKSTVAYSWHASQPHVWSASSTRSTISFC